jgi:16S rRNA (guanine966-N2)-methyltransferase
MQGKIRIIAGQWRGRKLPVLDKPGLRPTPDRVRETLFNWLTLDLPTSRCLDLFAGTGAVGIEAASRGAPEVVLVEKDRELVHNLNQQVSRLAASQITVIGADALHYLKNTTPRPFDLIFLDPPFGHNLLPPTCSLLAQSGWLSPKSLIYMEMERQLTPPAFLPGHWQITRNLMAGQLASYLIRLRNVVD